jgi:hypothetical protein
VSIGEGFTDRLLEWDFTGTVTALVGQGILGIVGPVCAWFFLRSDSRGK